MVIKRRKCQPNPSFELTASRSNYDGQSEPKCINCVRSLQLHRLYQQATLFYYRSAVLKSVNTHLLKTHSYLYYDSFRIPSLNTHLLETHSYPYYDSFRIPYVSDFSTETKRLTNHEQPRGTTWGQAPQTSGGRRVSNAWWTYNFVLFMVLKNKTKQNFFLRNCCVLYVFSERYDTHWLFSFCFFSLWFGRS